MLQEKELRREVKENEHGFDTYWLILQRLICLNLSQFPPILFLYSKSINSRPWRKKTQAHAQIQKSIINVSRSFSEANTTRGLGTENMSSNTVFSKQKAT